MPPIRSKRIPHPKAYKKAINEIAIYIASKPSLLQKIRDNNIDSLVSSIKREFCNVADGVNDGIFNDIAAFLNNPKQMKEPNCHQELREAMKHRKDEKERIKRIKALFVQECNLKEDDARRDKYLEKFTIVEVTRYQTPYPPPSNWVYESEQIHDIWHDHLQLDVAEDQNCIFVDSKTKEIVGLVARNWMAEGKKETLDWVNEIIMKECQVRKSVRLEDTGKLCQMGYSAGSRSKASFDWCPHKYALFWTTARTYGSEEGGHFFIADYGIRIKQSANSVVVWKPTDFHGTTLSVKGPTDESDSHQIGMSIVTPVRLVKLWEKYQQEQITADNVEAILVESDDSEEE
ncbi:hypothetical protein P167DRAFT_546252 [Morchella conica CCBAS932]|uniref:Uncharacterized protein n=1 Tax=Morchella conica CCBAS932 TaxID=1392247 RepID=A0A3N4KMG9_9PEZI|nr:hypothetical protein P167DRAFT_546252 [Morchella conica CCBAS932]